MADVEGVRPANQVWTTRIFCKRYGVNISKIKETASDIAKKDESFDYREEEGDLVILSEDKDTAHKRGLWMVNNVKELERVMDQKKYEVDWEEKEE